MVIIDYVIGNDICDKVGDKIIIPNIMFTNMLTIHIYTGGANLDFR